MNLKGYVWFFWLSFDFMGQISCFWHEILKSHQISHYLLTFHRVYLRQTLRNLSRVGLNSKQQQQQQQQQRWWQRRQRWHRFDKDVMTALMAWRWRCDEDHDSWRHDDDDDDVGRGSSWSTWWRSWGNWVSNIQSRIHGNPCRGRLGRGPWIPSTFKQLKNAKEESVTGLTNRPRDKQTDTVTYRSRYLQQKLTIRLGWFC